MFMRSLITATALAVISFVGPSPDLVDAAGPATDVEFETLGIVSGVEGIDLWPPALLRVRNQADIEWAADLLAAGGVNPFVDRVVGAIGDIPDGRVVLIGVIDVSCTAATTAGLTRGQDGHLVMDAPGHVPEPILCVVPFVTVAVLSVAADDAPPGSTDFAELVAFEFVGYDRPQGPDAVELKGSDADASALAAIMPADAGDPPTLPALAAGDRRFAFVLSACGSTTAELIITGSAVTARPDHDDPDAAADCARASYSVAVFDVPAAVVAGAMIEGG